MNGSSLGLQLPFVSLRLPLLHLLFLLARLSHGGLSSGCRGKVSIQFGLQLGNLAVQCFAASGGFLGQSQLRLLLAPLGLQSAALRPQVTAFRLQVAALGIQVGAPLDLLFMLPCDLLMEYGLSGTLRSRFIETRLELGNLACEFAAAGE